MCPNLTQEVYPMEPEEEEPYIELHEMFIGGTEDRPWETGGFKYTGEVPEVEENRWEAEDELMLRGTLLELAEAILESPVYEATVEEIHEYVWQFYEDMGLLPVMVQTKYLNRYKETHEAKENLDKAMLQLELDEYLKERRDSQCQ